MINSELVREQFVLGKQSQVQVWAPLLLQFHSRWRYAKAPANGSCPPSFCKRVFNIFALTKCTSYSLHIIANCLVSLTTFYLSSLLFTHELPINSCTDKRGKECSRCRLLHGISYCSLPSNQTCCMPGRVRRREENSMSTIGMSRKDHSSAGKQLPFNDTMPKKTACWLVAVGIGVLALAMLNLLILNIIYTYRRYVAVFRRLTSKMSHFPQARASTCYEFDRRATKKAPLPAQPITCETNVRRGGVVPNQWSRKEICDDLPYE